jgi:hypothetical protein
MVNGRNRRAAERTIKALRAAGALAATDPARIEMLRSLADAVDACPDNAALWRQYREAEITLREAVTNDDSLTEFLAGLSGPLGDAEKR